MDPEKYASDASNEVPPYGDNKTDIRKGSIVMGEAADLYGDIETAESEWWHIGR